LFEHQASVDQASILNDPQSNTSVADTHAFNFQQNYFELFELEVGCDIDSAQLRDRFMELQRDYHPDKHAASDDAERLLAVRIASFVNEAHQTLSVPLKRAEYVLQLHGVSTDTETDARMDTAFLMEQMEWREALEDVDLKSESAFDELDELRREISTSVKSVASEVEAHLDGKDLPSARDSIRQWQFLSKLIGEIDAAEAKADEAAG
jgi:molecular chaperone HscB